MPSRRVRHLMFSSKALGAKLSLFAPTLASLSDGDSVSTWKDLSGNGDATQTGSARPVYKVAQQGGQPTVNFAGSNYMTAASRGITSASVVVASKSTGTGLFNALTATGNFMRVYDYANDLSGKWGWTHGFGGVGDINISSAGYIVRTATFSSASTPTVTLYRNSLDVRNSGDGWRQDSFSYVYIGFDTFGTQYMVGYIGAIMIFDGVIAFPIQSRLQNSLGFTFRIAQSGS